MLYSKLVQGETREAKTLRSGTAGGRPEVNHCCHSQSEGRGCRKRWLPQTSTIKRATVVLTGRELHASWLPASEEPHLPGSDAQEAKGDGARSQSKPPSKEGDRYAE